MMHPCEELLILKSLIRMYEEVLAKDDTTLMFQIAVDIAESGANLELLSSRHNDKK